MAIRVVPVEESRSCTNFCWAQATFILDGSAESKGNNPYQLSLEQGDQLLYLKKTLVVIKTLCFSTEQSPAAESSKTVQGSSVHLLHWPGSPAGEPGVWPLDVA